MDVNTAKEVYALLLSISGVIIVIFIGIVGYFLKKVFDAVTSLDSTVAGLNTSVALINKTNESNDEICDLTHKQIDHELSSFDERLKGIEQKCFRRTRVNGKNHEQNRTNK